MIVPNINTSIQTTNYQNSVVINSKSTKQLSISIGMM